MLSAYRYKSEIKIRHITYKTNIVKLLKHVLEILNCPTTYIWQLY